ncbi:MAG TPA: cupin domain-containing protein [Solirubrobacteraceae bacterium]|jgi:uncharacterized cupin superfamily protein
MGSPERSPNIFEPQFEARGHPDNHDFDVRRAFIARPAGSQRLGASVWELEPGRAAYPYHAHLGDEELIIVLAGQPSLRTPEGWRDLQPGEAVAFLRGEEGAHQIVNRGSETVRFLAVSTNDAPDITLYPDAGKVGATERRPDGAGLRRFFFLDQAVDYWDGVGSEGQSDQAGDSSL